MAKEVSGSKASHREEAERILKSAGGSMATGSGTDDIAGAFVGVGEALLAIHDELSAIRNALTARHDVKREGKIGSFYAEQHA